MKSLIFDVLLLFQIVALCCFGRCLVGQNYYGDIELHNQAQIDSFPINYPGVTNIYGNVSIEYAEALDSLYSIELIDGYFILGGEFSDLFGLHNLVEVNGIFEIYSSNPGFQNLTGLSVLDQCLQIRLFGLDNFSDFNGLNSSMSSLESILMHNCNFIDFDGISNLTNVKVINIINCNFTSFNGLEHLDSLGVLAVQTNSEFESFEGLQSLTHIGLFYIFECYCPPNFDSLENLVSVFQIEFNLLNNPASLSGLENIDSDKLTNVIIWGSDFCTYDWLCQYFTENPGGGSLYGTGSCASVSALLQSCTTFTYSGTGNWNNSGNWSPFYPGYNIVNATIIIEGNLNISAQDNIQCNNCTIIVQETGSLVNNGMLNIFD